MSDEPADKDSAPDASPSPTRLYLTRDGKRFFLIPDDTTLPAGDLELRSLGRPWARVDAEAAAPYQLTRARAGEFAEESLDSGWQAVRRLAAQVTGQDESSFPEHLSDLLGDEASPLFSDPEVARARARDALHRASELLENEVTVMKDLGTRIKTEIESTEVTEALDEVGQSLRHLGNELRTLFGGRPAPRDDEPSGTP